MPKATVTDTPQYPLIPEDTLFTAELRSVTEKTIEFIRKNDDERSGKRKGDKDSFTKWVWTFRIRGGEFDGEDVRGETSDRVTTHPENQPRVWGEALLGRAIDLDMEFDTDDFIGLSCQLEVEHETYEKNGETRVVPKVAQLFPLGAGAGNVIGAGEPPF